MKQILQGVALFACLLSPLVTLAQVPDTQYSDSLAYITGGVGDEETAAILSEAKQWPLMLQLSQIESGRGIWIFGAKIKIVNSKQKIIFDAQANGPYMLVNIDPGEYVLLANYQGVEQKRALMVRAGQAQKMTIFWK